MNSDTILYYTIQYQQSIYMEYFTEYRELTFMYTVCNCWAVRLVLDSSSHCSVCLVLDSSSVSLLFALCILLFLIFYVFNCSFHVNGLAVYVCFLCCVFCVFFIFCVLFLLLYIAVSLLSVYNFTDRCQRVETQLQLINMIFPLYGAAAQRGPWPPHS